MTTQGTAGGARVARASAGRPSRSSLMPSRFAPLHLVLLISLAVSNSSIAMAGEFEHVAGNARGFRKDVPVAAQSDGAIIAEAEEFDPAAGWKAMNWGENYYAATIANTFLSRKAFLGADAQAD